MWATTGFFTIFFGTASAAYLLLKGFQVQVGVELELAKEESFSLEPPAGWEEWILGFPSNLQDLTPPLLALPAPVPVPVEEEGRLNGSEPVFPLWIPPPPDTQLGVRVHYAVEWAGELAARVARALRRTTARAGLALANPRYIRRRRDASKTKVCPLRA